jgi:hypothetical protein
VWVVFGVCEVGERMEGDELRWSCNKVVIGQASGILEAARGNDVSKER